MRQTIVRWIDVEPRTAPSGDAVVYVATLALALCCLPVFTRIVLTIPLHTPLNYNEGWNAYHAMDVIRGSALYPHPPRLFFNNYPPLSFYLIAGATRLVGDPIVAGRCISLISFVVWTLLLARTARLFHCRHGEAWFAALLFAALTLLFSDYVGVDDPEFLGHAVATSALLLLLRQPRSTLRLLFSALLLSAAVFIKQNLIALPLACVLWLIQVDRRAGWRLIVFGAAVAIAGAGLCVAIFGPDAVLPIIAPRAYVLQKAGLMSLRWIIEMVVFISMLLIVVRALPEDEGVRFCGSYAATAGILGCMFSGGEGVNWNVFFDGNWALSLGAAISLNRLSLLWRDDRGPRRRARLVAAYLMIPVIVVAVDARAAWSAPRSWLTAHVADAADAERDVEFLRRHEGPTLCEDLALCFWSGKPVEVDFFNTQQRLHSGWNGADDLVRLVEMRHFGAVQTDVSTRSLGPRFAEALRRAYRVDYEGSNGRFWIPRD
jgi:hypothetical protein